MGTPAGARRGGGRAQLPPGQPGPAALENAKRPAEFPAFFGPFPIATQDCYTTADFCPLPDATPGGQPAGIAASRIAEGRATDPDQGGKGRT